MERAAKKGIFIKSENGRRHKTFSYVSRVSGNGFGVDSGRMLNV